MKQLCVLTNTIPLQTQYRLQISKTNPSCWVGYILKRQTYEKFGYRAVHLRPCSFKIVVWSCARCGCIRYLKFRDAKRTLLCLRCSNKINSVASADRRSDLIKVWHRHNKHPLEGTHRPKYVLDALRKAHLGISLSKATRAKISEKTRGVNNPFFGKKHTKKSLRKMARFQKRHARKGKACNFYGKCYFSKRTVYIDRFGNPNNMKSSWELKYAEHLDKNNIDWKYEHRTFDLMVNGRETSYTPDFYLVKENRYVEIKGLWRKDAKVKFAVFKRTYPNEKISLFTGIELKKLGVLH